MIEENSSDRHGKDKAGPKAAKRSEVNTKNDDDLYSMTAGGTATHYKCLL